MPCYVCCTFAGATLGSSTSDTGRIVWQSFSSEQLRSARRLRGWRVRQSAAIDLEHVSCWGRRGRPTRSRLRRRVPRDAPGSGEACILRADFNSVVAFDIRTGHIRWAFRGAGFDACANSRAAANLLLSRGARRPATRGPTPERVSLWDFAGSRANVSQGARERQDTRGRRHRAEERRVLGRSRPPVNTSGAGSSVRLRPGGISGARRHDGARIYAAIGQHAPAYNLPSGETITAARGRAIPDDRQNPLADRRSTRRADSPR